jgi:hypothetical protein
MNLRTGNRQAPDSGAAFSAFGWHQLEIINDQLFNDLANGGSAMS